MQYANISQKAVYVCPCKSAVRLMQLRLMVQGRSCRRG